MAAAGTGWVLGQLLLLTALGTGLIRSIWPQVHPDVTRAAGLLVGPALFGSATAFAMYFAPGAAGVAVGWLVVLGLAAVVIRQQHLSLADVLPNWRHAALWLLAFVVVLSARQQYWIPDAMVHTPLSASIVAGTFPPRLPWSPDVPAIYHFLPELVIGSLDLGFGPGLVLTTEILGAFVAVAVAVLVASIAVDLGAKRLGIIVALPLLLSPGLWALVLFRDRPEVLQMAVPVGVPEAGLRAALGSMYVPDVASAAATPVEAAPPNIINPHFVWSYGLAVTVALLATARAAHWLSAAAVIAFLLSALSAIDEVVFVAGLVALGGFLAVDTLRDRHGWQSRRSIVMATLVGICLTLVQGGVFSDLLFRAPRSTETIGLNVPMPALEWLGAVQTVGGGLGAVGVGTVAVLILGGCVAYLTRSVALAIVGAMALALFAGYTVVHFPASPADTARLEGHALNFAMILLTVGLSVGICRLPTRASRFGVSLMLAGLVVWPTSVDSIGRMAEAVADGPRLYVAGTRPFDSWESFSRRSSLDAEIEEHRPLLDAISESVSTDERILTSDTKLITAGTGRPAPLGYAEWPHYVGLPGPEYQDAVHSLDHAALRELRIDFIHVDDALLGPMSDEARRRLEMSSEFRLVYQAPGPLSDRLYAVVEQPPVARAPAPTSFRALAELAAGRRVLISSAMHPLERLPLYYTLRATDDLYGRWDDPAHFRRNVQIQPPTGDAVDLIALPDTVYPAPLEPVHRAPAWTRAGVRVYDLEHPGTGGIPRSPIRVEGHSLLDAAGLQITSLPGWSDNWTGTDWMVFREAEPNSGIPAILEKGHVWFPGQLAPKSPGQRIEIRFDASRGQLELRRADGGWSAVGDVDRVLPADSYVLTLRFTSEGRAIFFVPVAVVALAEEAPLDRVFAQGDT